MSTSKLFFSLRSSLLRYHSVTRNLPVRFPSSSPSLRFNRFCSSATLTSDSTEASVLPPLAEHPWPEWVTFVDRLKSQGYFNDNVSSTVPPLSAAVGGGGDEDESVSYRDASVLKHACLNFARERFDIFKSLSRKDIKKIVEKGCPGLFRKGVNSAKRLRADLRLDEGEVCGGCNLRGSCDKAYTVIKDSEASARTVDVVRILLLYALDQSVISGGEMSPGREDIEASARKLLSELIDLSETVPDPTLPKPSLPRAASKAPRGPLDDEKPQNVEMKRGDWICRECDYMNFAKNMQCLKCKADGPKRVVPSNIEMKKGDWNCSGCGFMNFASKTSCFRCRQPAPKRQLNPGEWVCPSCNYLNFRNNTACKKCECDRPRDNNDRPRDNNNTQHGQQIWKKPTKFR